MPYARDAVALARAACGSLGTYPCCPRVARRCVFIPKSAVCLTCYRTAHSMRCCHHRTRHYCTTPIASAQQPWPLARRTRVLRKSISPAHVSVPRLLRSSIISLFIESTLLIWAHAAHASVSLQSSLPKSANGARLLYGADCVPCAACRMAQQHAYCH